MPVLECAACGGLSFTHHEHNLHCLVFTAAVLSSSFVLFAGLYPQRVKALHDTTKSEHAVELGFPDSSDDSLSKTQRQKTENLVAHWSKPPDMVAKYAAMNQVHTVVSVHGTYTEWGDLC